ncbi:unnamed protein product [Lactuca saligna]|uniref:Uncharacterized protein n=1 Tax=Lactuca saligna TaxID=75948 RepID=A0AA35Y1E0_LACSI|nr:unnamed protein product [Lactuca saligna]
MLEEDLEEEQGGAHDVGPDEYTGTGYEFEGSEENPEGDPIMGREVGLEVEPEEYVVNDYEYGESDQELDEGKNVEEARNEPHLSKAPSDLRMVQKGDTDHLRSLEEEIISLRL